MGRIRALASVLVLLVVGSAAALADDPDRTPWLGGVSYEKKDVYALGDATVEVHEDPARPREGPTQGWYRLLVLRDGAIVDGYRVDSWPEDGGRTSVALSWLDRAGEDDGVLVATGAVPEDSTALAVAKDLVAAAVGARGPWEAASALLARAVQTDDPTARAAAALTAYRALERARTRFPDHLGVLRDLVVADTLLVPLEAGSDRGANLAFLWRDHVAALEAASSLDADVAPAREARIVCALAEGCYALAVAGLGFYPPEEAERAEVFRRALEGVGQAVQEPAESIELSLPDDRALTLSGWRCPGEVPASGVPFHRLTWLCAESRPDAQPKAVWYSLTGEAAAGGTRWALYGWVGGSRRLLRLYGATEPSAPDVLAALRAHAEAAIAGAKR